MPKKKMFYIIVWQIYNVNTYALSILLLEL